MHITALLLASLSAILSILLFLKLKWPAPILWFLKLYTSSLSLVFALIGMFSIIVGIAISSLLIILIGIYDALVFSIHIFRITRPPDSSTGFERAFGLDWENEINPKHKKVFLSKRVILRLPVVPDPRFEQNIAFATIPGANRQLLCDVWQPYSGYYSFGAGFYLPPWKCILFSRQRFSDSSFVQAFGCPGACDYGCRLSTRS